MRQCSPDFEPALVAARTPLLDSMGGLGLLLVKAGAVVPEVCRRVEWPRRHPHGAGALVAGERKHPTCRTWSATAKDPALSKAPRTTQLLTEWQELWRSTVEAADHLGASLYSQRVVDAVIALLIVPHGLTDAWSLPLVPMGLCYLCTGIMGALWPEQLLPLLGAV
eukprot:COSAG01_NODE_13428_length_1587_cov_0.811828_1_plen_165_part_10